jgi:hypothetical protein
MHGTTWATLPTTPAKRKRTTVISFPAVLRNAFVHFNFRGLRFFVKFFWHLERQKLNTCNTGTNATINFIDFDFFPTMYSKRTTFLFPVNSPSRQDQARPYKYKAKTKEGKDKTNMTRQYEEKTRHFSTSCALEHISTYPKT